MKNKKALLWTDNLGGLLIVLALLLIVLIWVAMTFGPDLFNSISSLG
jgi:hypothetical protein